MYLFLIQHFPNCKVFYWNFCAWLFKCTIRFCTSSCELQFIYNNCTNRKAKYFWNDAELRPLIKASLNRLYVKKVLIKVPAFVQKYQCRLIRTQPATQGVKNPSPNYNKAFKSTTRVSSNHVRQINQTTVRISERCKVIVHN